MAKPEEWEAFGKEDWKSVFTVADWLRCDAYLSAQQGKYQHAMESCLGILNTGESTKDVPGSMPVLTRLNVHLTMIEAVERVLAQGTAPDATLQTAQASLEKIAQENTYLHHVRNQRVWGNLLFVDVRDGKAPSSKLAGYASDSHAQWYNKYPSSLVYFYPRHLNHMNQLVEIAKAPIHERAAKLAAVESANPLADAVVLPELHEQVLENAGLVRSAIAALACERYCLARQQWPEDWNALIREKYLQEIPLDPVDGAPLRLRATDNGIVMYSIGKNGIDEKGDMPRHIGATAGDDQGFRLWDERFRGQPSMDRKNAK
jgi:hypothetical protein